MAYIDKDYILSRSDKTEVSKILDNGSGVFDDAKLNLIIADAESVVNGKLNVKYTTPLNQAPADIKRIVLDIALYFIYGMTNTDEEMEGISNRYNRALKSLDNIAQGYQKIDGATEVSANSSGIMVSTIGRERKYNEDMLKRMF